MPKKTAQKNLANNYLVLAFFIIGSQIAGGIGSIFTVSAIPTWYMALTKPFFSPPNWVFAPVWTILYTLIGISGYLVWAKYRFAKPSRLFWQAYFIQLLLNALWSIIFFGYKNTLIALIEIVLMWIFIFLTIKKSSKLSPLASYLLYPYLAWVSFATLLNFAIVILN